MSESHLQMESYYTFRPLWSSMGKVVPACTSPTTSPIPSHCTVIILYNSQCINCCYEHFKSEITEQSICLFPWEHIVQVTDTLRIIVDAIHQLHIKHSSMNT